MERIQHLINKLVDQKAQGETPAQLLMTVQLLQQELISNHQNNEVARSSKVSVVMPPGFITRVEEEAPEREKKPTVSIPEKDKQYLPAEPILFTEENIKAEAAFSPAPVEEKRGTTQEIYALNKPPETKIPKEVKQPEPIKYFSLPFEGFDEAPTLLQHSLKQKEIHEAVGEKKESLNDKLKQEKLELGHVLKEEPIKDLRKGIGVNDKFLFINELFRGDEDMYERSIKTINGFRILPEAEYWINRELKVKLGWNDSKDTVQHFYGIVRRRFS
jgi:hypothetical protein